MDWREKLADFLTFGGLTRAREWSDYEAEGARRAERRCDSWREFKAWRDIGIEPLRALVAATSANAKIIGRNDLGVLAPGKTADIAAWGKNIMTDHKAISECDFVMKDGTIYKTKK